jgi:hypothetical protein
MPPALCTVSRYAVVYLKLAQTIIGPQVKDKFVPHIPHNLPNGSEQYTSSLFPSASDASLQNTLRTRVSIVGEYWGEGWGRESSR